LKSNEVLKRPSDQLELARLIYIDACAKCIADVSDLRDMKTIKSRVKAEGISFLTITLPQFCKDFERSLAEGQISSTLFRGFRRRGSIPAFLQGMISLIFDHETGRIINENKSNEIPTIIESIRQICLAFKKMELECTSERTSFTLENFINIERSFETFQLSEQDNMEFNHVSSILWDNLMANISLDKCVPRHGPGTTAERITGNQKYVWQSWHERLEPYFPFFPNAYLISASDSKEFEKVTFLQSEQELPVKVTPVPKTLKGPRIIAIEPVAMQYGQQAVSNALYKCIETSDIAKGHINFSDQSVNQQLAVKSSRTGLLATIDLSDASDRVPRSLALGMFRGNPDIQDAIEACRSTSAKMPDGRIIRPLGKFASMGSALCFPVESMYFYTICVAALLKVHNLPVTYTNCFSVSRHVYVYGDDLVVPSTYANAVLDYLQKYNCKVNTSKTFITGKFRESCGIDAYDGEPVTPVYIRRKHPKDRRDVRELISFCATANLFYLKGYWHTASYMFKTCERILGPLPYISPISSALGRISFLGYRSVERWNTKLQRFEIKAWVPSPVYRSDKIDGYAALQKSLLSLEAFKPTDLNLEMTSEWRLALYSKGLIPLPGDLRHLERTALRGRVALKCRWVPSLL